MSPLKAGDEVRAKPGALGRYGDPVGGKVGVVRVAVSRLPDGYVSVLFNPGEPNQEVRHVEAENLERVQPPSSPSEPTVEDVLAVSAALGVVDFSDAEDVAKVRTLAGLIAAARAEVAA